MNLKKKKEWEPSFTEELAKILDEVPNVYGKTDPITFLMRVLYSLTGLNFIGYVADVKCEDSYNEKLVHLGGDAYGIVNYLKSKLGVVHKDTSKVVRGDLVLVEVDEVILLGVWDGRYAICVHGQYVCARHEHVTAAYGF